MTTSIPPTPPTTPALPLLEQKRTIILARLAKVDAAIALEQSKITIDCTFCKAVFPIGDLTYIQTHWYVEPFSCTGGDYWNEGEGNFKCPTCGATNRMHNREAYQQLKNRFKNIVKTHDR